MKLTVDQALRRAATFALKGKKADAERLYREVLRVSPGNPRAADGLHAIVGSLQQDLAERSYDDEIALLVELIQQDNAQQALAGASALTARYPEAPLPHSIAGVAEAKLGRFEQAVAHFDKSLALAPGDADTHRNRGNALRSLERLEEAIASYDEALRIDPEIGDAQFYRGNCLKDLGRPGDAIVSYEAALQRDAGLAALWYNYANALQEVKRPEQALEGYDRTIELAPNFAEAYNNRGNVLRELGRSEDALKSYDEALRLKPDLPSVQNNRSVVLQDLKRLDEALASIDAALEQNPDHSAHNNRGVILLDLNRPQEALESFDRSVRMKPDFAIAYNNAGNALQDLDRLDEALICYDAALRVDPDTVSAHGNRGNALDKLGRPLEAVASYAKALRLKPDLASARALMLYQKAHICDWTQPVADADLASIGIVDEAVGPFTMLSADGDAGRQLARAAHWRKAKLPPTPPPLPTPPPRPEKLRIGYFSADFHDHAVMLLIGRVYELHDRGRFELHAFSYGPDKKDMMRKRAVAAFDRFYDVRNLTDAAVAGLAREVGIDVAVDLSGYTRGARTGILAHRAAPVQINYLGYPGSMGADFIDYIMVDHVIVPPELQRFYSEKAIYLPHSYQANDNRRYVAERSFTRAELGLPEDGFVFCCFNNNYKISPAEFDIWMRLLGKVEGSVLWLLEANEWARANLGREAEARGIDRARIVFAPRMVSADHLARHRCADLFLDTFNYNAHTTGSDALWTGLPIVTLLGESFAARVGGSLLAATGMSELVTRSAAEYERLALELATDPARLAAVRAKLAAALPNAPLFDTEAFTRDIERAYDLAYDRRASGLPADHIDLAAEAGKLGEPIA